MAKKKTNIGRRGPATNLRPAGPHKSDKDYDRKVERLKIKRGDYDEECRE